MAFAELDGDRVLVQTSWSEKDVVRQVPGSRYDTAAKVWHVPLSWAACLVLRGVFGPTLTVGPGLDAWAAEEIRTRVVPSNTLRVMHDLAPGTVMFDPRLRPFQHLDVSWLLTAGDALLCNDMGTGKTISALTYLRVLQRSENPLPALVICPNSVKIPWSRETATWFPEATPYVVAGTAPVRAKVLAAALADPTALVIVNIEILRSLSRVAPYGSIRMKKCRACDPQGDESLSTTRCEVHPKVLNEFAFRTVVLDEAHRIKDPSSLQTRAVWALMHAPAVTRRLGLTGTPVANHPGDLWSVMHGVSPTDFPTRTKFVDRYCLAAWNPYGTLNIVGIQPEHRDEFFRIVDPRVRRMPRELVLPQLPPRVPTTRTVEMTPKQARAYRELEQTMLTTLDDGSLLTAPGNMVRVQRLMQLASSYCEVDTPDPDDPSTWTVRLTEPSPKVDELLVVMEELGDAPLVVCAESRQLVNLAAARLERLGVPHGLITGGQNTVERQRALDDFQEGRTRVLLFTIKAGGTGLTMTRANTIVFLQRSWSMVDNEQSEGRVRRIGSEGHASVNVVDIVAAGTVEVNQVTRLYQKYEQLQTILRDRELLVAAGMPTDHLDREYNAVMNSHLGG